MKKIVTSLLLATLLGTTANAFSNVTDPYDADFARMNQYFNSLIESHLTSAKLNNIGYPRMDIQDSKKEITIKFDLAGVNKENIKLSISNDKILTPQLPENIDESKLSTKFENGILTVTIPKTEIKKPKAKIIPIK